MAAAYHNNVSQQASSHISIKIFNILFADDQVIISCLEDELQKSTHKLNKLINKYGMNISTEKTKTMAFCGPEPIRSKIVIDNKIIQVNVFNYLGCSLSYKGKKGYRC
jgi:hypothetical protein